MTDENKKDVGYHREKRLVNTTEESNNSLCGWGRLRAPVKEIGIKGGHHTVWVSWCPAQGHELDSMILMGPFQLSTFLWFHGWNICKLQCFHVTLTIYHPVCNILVLNPRPFWRERALTGTEWVYGSPANGPNFQESPDMISKGMEN